MKPISLVIKYYCFTIFFGVLAGFYGYVTRSEIPVYLNILFYVFLVWGLIHSHLKDSEAKHTKKDFITIYLALCIPAALLVVFAPSMLGVHFSILHIMGSVFAIFICNILLLFGMFYVSKQIILSAPVDDE